MPGGLLSKKPKSLPAAAPTVVLKHETGTDGGPVLALPKEAVAQWGSKDYERACAVSEGARRSPWGGYGFIDVGKLRGLVLGRHCAVAKVEDSWLLVMEGDGEQVAALLKKQNDGSGSRARSISRAASSCSSTRLIRKPGRTTSPR